MALAVWTLGGCTSKAPRDPVGVSGRPLPRESVAPAPALEDSASEDGEEVSSHPPVDPLALPFAGKKRHAEQRDEDVDDAGDGEAADDGDAIE